MVLRSSAGKFGKVIQSMFSNLTVHGAGLQPQRKNRPNTNENRDGEQHHIQGDFPRKTGIHHDIDKDYDNGYKEKKQGHDHGFPQLVAMMLIVKRGDPTAAGALSEGLVENVENEWLLAVCTSEPAGSGRGLSCSAAQRQAGGRLPSSTIAGFFDYCYYSLAEKKNKMRLRNRNWKLSNQLTIRSIT